MEGGCGDQGKLPAPSSSQQRTNANSNAELAGKQPQPPGGRAVTSNNSTGSGSGNNSDNSGIVSLGNNSFGFNFEEEGMMTIPNADGSGKGSDSDGSLTGGKPAVPHQQPQQPLQPQQPSQQQQQQPQQHPLQPQQPSQQHQQQQSLPSAATSKPTMIPLPGPITAPQKSHAEAAAEAVANLKSIAASNAPGAPHMLAPQVPVSNPETASTISHATSHDAMVSLSSSSSSVVGMTPSEIGSMERPKKKAKKLDENKREERNAREKERSFRISRQINELRNLLSSGGVIVPKGTKSSVLTEAANYIRMLQQHQYRSEIDRHQLVQQMQMIGGGALGQQAASAIRHVAAQNGVWSLGNFGGVPPKSAMSYYQGSAPAATAQPAEAKQSPDPNAPLPTKIEDPEYRFIFNSCSVGMAIASMGGAFIDCNQLFCQLSNYSKQEVCSMTIFNLTSRQDLQHAFDLISRMISPPVDGRQSAPKLCVLRGAMKNRSDLGLSVTLIKGDDGIAKCFCVTLIKNPLSPFDPSKPNPASADMIQQQPVIHHPQQQPVVVQQIQPATVQHAPGAQLPIQQPVTVQQHQQVTIHHQAPVTIHQQPAPKENGAGSLNSSPAYTTG